MAVLPSKGSKLQITIATTLTDIADVTQFGFSGSEVGTFETSVLNQTAAGRTYGINGFSEGGSVAGTCYYDPSNAVHQALTDLITTPVNDKAFNAIWNATATGTDWAFTGIVTSFDPSANLNDPLSADFGIKLDGLPTYST